MSGVDDKVIEAVAEAIWRTDAVYNEASEISPSAFIVEAEAAIEVLQSLGWGKLPEWRDISEAPRDGTQVIVNAPQLESESTNAYWENGHWHLAYNGKRFGIHVKGPTHWQHLPAPPTDKQEG